MRQDALRLADEIVPDPGGNIAAGDPVWAAHIADTDFDARMDADDLWLARMRAVLVASIAGGGPA